MNHRPHRTRVKTAVAERNKSSLPYVLLLIFLALLSGQAQAQGYGKGGEVHWERKRWTHDELPATLPSPVRDAVSDWGPWAEEHGYGLLLDETRQVFLAVEKRDRTAAKQLKVIDKTLELIEELALAKESTSSPTTFGSKSGSPAERSTLAPDEEQGSAESEGARWGRALGFDKHRVPVIALVHDHETLNSVLRHWMALRPELDWQQDVWKNHVSFISEEPLFAVIVTRDEWDLDHETTALLTRLMLKRTYGPLPRWIEAGITWQVETRLYKSVWHFFHRESQFVPSSSHSGWERELRSMLRRRQDCVGLFTEAAELNTKEWRDRDAYLAWGMTGFAMEELEGRLPQFLHKLRELQNEGARIEQPDGSWIYDISFVPSSADQFSALADLLDDDLEERALKVFKRGLKRTGEPR